MNFKKAVEREIGVLVVKAESNAAALVKLGLSYEEVRRVTKNLVMDELELLIKGASN